ncbi:Purine nucleoside permease [Pleurostoma richardsiae]|uniref:Purine nucleoside permease n=1 Tax=Pleurostoma richardsiae TaxID=41990 RepID=A0AA38RM42_9PEZI|nr:Purine nucleoside permease [Pleurostoma richardsiae]
MYLLTNSLLASIALNAVAASKCPSLLSPKVVVVTFYDDEATAYLSHQDELDFNAVNITIPGASPEFPDLHCTSTGDVCLVTTGEGMTNAGNSIMALWNTARLDLTQTYFLTTGIAGGNPEVVGTNSVIFARFLVQPSMQYEIDAREIPENFTTGYFPQGTYSPDDNWGYVYNTEVFSVNSDLRDLAAAMVNPAELVDTDDARLYRERYAVAPAYAASLRSPGVVRCDTATSDNWFSGELLAGAVGERMRVWTNGSAVYCATAQEDGAVVAALLRAALAGKVDYNRIISMRSISDIDRPYPGQTVLQNLVYEDPGSYSSSIDNVYVAGSAIVRGILAQWDEQFKAGIPPTKYTGDLWGTLGGTPDFGPGRTTGGYPVDVPGALGRRKRKRSERRRGLDQ